MVWYRPSNVSNVLQGRMKEFRGKMKGMASRGNHISFGKYALQALELSWLTAQQIEAGRKAMGRCGGKVWVRLSPDKTITKKPNETRMGRGKGAKVSVASVVKPGRILYELDGVSENTARTALQLAAGKMPIRTRFIKGCAGPAPRYFHSAHMLQYAVPHAVPVSSTMGCEYKKGIEMVQPREYSLMLERPIWGTQFEHFFAPKTLILGMKRMFDRCRPDFFAADVVRKALHQISSEFRGDGWSKTGGVKFDLYAAELARMKLQSWDAALQERSRTIRTDIRNWIRGMELHVYDRFKKILSYQTNLNATRDVKQWLTGGSADW